MQLLCLQLLSAQTTRISPLPVYIDDHQIISGAWLEWKETAIGLSPAAWLELDRTNEEIAQAFVAAMLRRDIELAHTLTIPDANRPPEQQNALLQGYSDLVAENDDSLLLESWINKGDERLLVWSVDNPETTGQRLARSFRFLPDGSGNLLFEGFLRDPVSILITDIFQEELLRGGLPSSPQSDLKYHYRVPNTDGNNEVLFRFDGEILNIDLSDSNATSANPYVATYIAAHQALMAADPSAWTSYWTSYSGGRIENWLNVAEPGTLNDYINDIQAVGRRLVFFLDADPVGFIFYTPTHPDIRGAPLQYAVIVRSEDGQYRLANFFIEGYYDDILKSRELFEEPFLRPLLRNEGVLDPVTSRGPVSSTVNIGPPDDPPLLPPEPSPDDEPAPAPDTLPGSGDGIPLWWWALLLLIIATAAIWRLRKGKNNPPADPQ